MTTATPTTNDTTTFADLGLAPELVQALDEQGITTPFPIQELTLGLALQGADIIGQARTGTGKTLGFGLPMLQRLDPDAGGHVQVLVIVPTRELCVQVAEDLDKAGKHKGVGVLAVYGGKSLDPQIDALRTGDVQVVVGTPGRLLDLMRRGDLGLSKVRGLVLDEADEMLDLGFLPDVEQLIQATAEPRQTLLFSATMPSAVVALARRYMEKPTFLRADVEEVHIGPDTEQHFFSCHRMDKPAVLARILQAPNRGLCVVFSRTKRMCDILAEELRDRGINAAPIHSDLRQESREKALTRFREGKIDVLVATEVAARGLDIDDVTHVVNYDCPDDEKMYLHRIGRTGRAGAAGVAITLAVWNELARLNMIKKALDIDVETHEVFSTSPILDELFDLPAREERPKPTPKPRAAKAKTPGSQPGGKGKGGGRGADRRDDAARRSPEKRRASTSTDERDTEGKSRIRRRRGASEGSERAPERSRRDTTPNAPAAPSSDESTDGPTTRVRRRSRTRSETATETGGDSGAESTTRPRESGSREEVAGRDGAARTRTRTRTSGERASGGRAGSDGDASRGDASRGDASQADAARSRTRTRTRRDAEPGDGGGDGDKDGGRSRAARPSSGGGGQSPRSRSGGGRSGGGRAKGGRSGRARSGGTGGTGGRGEGRAQQTPRAKQPQVTSDEARGDGQPRLRRPLEVSHLP